jgi:hypothetical protein
MNFDSSPFLKQTASFKEINVSKPGIIMKNAAACVIVGLSFLAPAASAKDSVCRTTDRGQFFDRDGWTQFSGSCGAIAQC